MALTEQDILRIIYPRPPGLRGRRFTQDTPILPDVWINFGTGDEDTFHELLLTPFKNSSIHELVMAVREQLKKERAGAHARVAYHESHVLVRVNFRMLVRAILPLSDWWRREIGWKKKLNSSVLDSLQDKDDKDFVGLFMESAKQDDKNSFFTESVLDLIRIMGMIGIREPLPDMGDLEACRKALECAISKAKDLLNGIEVTNLKDRPARLWSVFTNRKATTALVKSRLTVKADATVRLFEISCQNLCWAVIDSGIDARHTAFAVPGAKPTGQNEDFSHATRVVKTYDFSRLKDLIFTQFKSAADTPSAFTRMSKEEQRKITRDIKSRLIKGLQLDWPLLEPFLEIPHDNKYATPMSEHGTHVAGILAANSRKGKDGEPVVGMCPDIGMYDLRVTDADGFGDEFCIIAALQYVRYLNTSKECMVLQGVNLSMSIPHKVQSFACGSTPICDECNRLVANGTVVVVSAGNSGFSGEGINAAVDYRDISITDPGNAQDVITVGSTHREMPHKYGVSYFSSRGPTGDGRLKPDLVAPGERICSTIPGDQYVSLDGTSMAAPHVSGAAALLMARHSELIRNPYRIKEILCQTATDLGRERRFQGAGVLDVLRAIQSL